MKNTHRLLMLILLLGYTHGYGQKNKGFLLEGDIQGLKNGTSIYLITKEMDTIGRTASVGSKFKFLGHVAGEANYFFIRLDTLVNKKFSTALWLVNSNLKVTGALNEWPQLKLEGSEPHNEFTEVRMLSSQAESQEQKKVIWKRFVDSHPNSLYVSDLILKVYNVTERQAAYDKLTSRAKASWYGLELKRFLESMAKNNVLKGIVEKNGTIPDFEFNMADGRRTSILKIASGSKFTLIDFWASWCAPCRAAVPKLKETYEAFNTKGFNIVGLSRDKDMTAWKKAIAEDKTVWTHGIDNIDNAGKNIFDLMAIPGYILIDQQGRIIQMDIFSNADNKVRLKQPGDKNLGSDLYEIIEGLLKKEKGK